MAEKITSKKLYRVCQQIELSGQLPGFRAFKDLLICDPMNDALLRCFCFYPNLYVKETFEVRAVFLPQNS